ncbi:MULTISPECIES: GIY-YIG nuclease family protein [unclassified Pseudomonas]|uniref:GIY-YIG nuclease family protein n=1 Tax=unclassified Pseudomonas TaxID=196821 RepID=UPI0008770025|nr:MULTISPECIES: GIY-YIG nuclease family protein [unclassified Pseudomonas]SCZ33374.1 GIY-YIG catalytic domain-containing protein [Pseudomonas sp. NFACC44-2]SDA79957.1 GIY-YIG catalytic domain-containing protein [Pseudomonas sp. NFACC51]SFH67096.1 GIY-YIG catalytic domain-containing protein [Pseudomonas sp. NFACC54]SFT17406.1 GIY-YIG catalytic domain-containing protein [Pseudomonas sp. NFACC48-1]
MLTPATLNDIACHLRDLAGYVERTPIDSLHEVFIPFSEIRKGYPAQALETLKTWSSSKARYIYQMSVDDAVCEDLYLAFAEAKDTRKNDRAYCRLNPVSRLLYVGSSANLDARIKQHLGFGNKGTYALQLSHWLPEREGMLRIQAWRFSKEVDVAVVQAIEDGLWASNRPMFGRQGAR